MVRGINKFREYFAGYESNYIIIGGTACDILDEKNIRKHKNDIFRLATMLTRMDKFILPTDIQNDMDIFCQMVSQSLPDNAFFKSIGLPTKPEDVFDLLCNAFQINQK